MRITLAQLEAFVAVVEAGTFEEAARALSVTQSTISKRISDLEDATRVRLFDRSQRRANLTGKGHVFFERARELTRLAAELEDQDFGYEQKVYVRAGFTELASLTWLPRFLEKSVSGSPELEYQITIGLSRDLMQMAEDDELDIIVIPEMHFPSTVNYRKVAELEVALFAKPGSIRRRQPVTIAELRDFEIIMQGARSGYSAKLALWLHRHGLRKKPNVQIDSQHATLGLVVAGKGMCIAAKKYLSSLAETGKLEEIPTNPKLPNVDYFVVYKKSARDGFFWELSRQIEDQIDFDSSFF